MSEYDQSGSDRSDSGGRGIGRRKVFECMTWAGTGILWTIAGGVPRSEEQSPRAARADRRMAAALVATSSAS